MLLSSSIIALGWATLVAAAPAVEIIEVAKDVPDSLGNNTVSSISHNSDEIHANIMGAWPTDLITVSSEVQQFIQDRYTGAEMTFYLEDEQTFITVPEGDNSTLDARDGCSGGNYISKKVTASQSYWDSWEHISSCIKSDKGSTATVTYSISVSKGWSADIGLSFTAIKDVVQSSLGFSIVQTWTYGSSYGCSVPAKSVGQVWGRHYYGWAEIQYSSCTCFICRSPSKGTVRVPRTGSDSQQYGCSVGSANVVC